MTSKWTILAAAVAVGAAAVVGSAVPASAYPGECRDRVEAAQIRYDRARDTFGPGSWQARNRWRELNRVRDYCWGRYHGWWNPHAHIWVTTHW